MLKSGSATSLKAAFERSEAALQSGSGLRGTGFWKAVSRLRRDPSLAEVWADRAGRIDREFFERSMRLRMPIAPGMLLLGLGTLAGVAAVVLTPRFTSPLRELVFLAGFGLLEIAPHSLTHWLVGRATGIRFTHVFLGGPKPPRPGVKADYASYLRTPARLRAVMHASGAVVTKIVPFALIPAALHQNLASWVFWLLLLVGVVQIATDVMFSTKNSDWMKAMREWKAAG